MVYFGVVQALRLNSSKTDDYIDFQVKSLHIDNDDMKAILAFVIHLSLPFGCRLYAMLTKSISMKRLCIINS